MAQKRNKKNASTQSSQTQSTNPGKIEVEGVVQEALPGANFLVQIGGESGPVVSAYVAGRMRRANIALVVGDKVILSLSPYDPSKGIINKRINKSKNTLGK